MAYTVLARKYRSWTFDELVGQQAVATTLKNAIASGRIHHGYLFCGTRGVGKTSAARILARSLNCLKAEGPTATPCCECESCLAIAEGQDVDVIEIDAASNTGVDNIRELRSNTAYRPARARFKIYIIDEVHMLSTGAFNALLKTLEEPPGHIKFILATTESQKVPATIQSRCLRFDFRSISADDIAGHFQEILKKEKIKAEPAVIRRVARLANGSMRDGLSLLDQLLSMGREKLTADMIDDVLPMPHDEVLTRLIGQLADRDAAGALKSLDESLSAGYSLERFTESLGEQIRTLMLLSVCGAQTELVELPGPAAEAMAELSKHFDAEAYVYMLSVLEELRRSVRSSPLGRPLLEAGLVRLAGAVRYRSIQRILDELGEARAAEEDPSKKKVRELPAPGAADLPRPTSPASPIPGSSVPPSGGGDRPPSAGHAPARGRPQPAPAVPAPAPASRPATSEDLKAATSDPAVREAMELFGGSLVNVERLR
ncbi:MAG: hypothetical protein AMXMBFR13_00200 [Phycisphaerae bacterium]